MFSKRTIKGTALALCLAVAVLGCETYGQSAGLGAALGAGAGAIIGNQSGHAGEGAAIGALLGGATGLIWKDIKVRREERRVASAQQTMTQYEYKPAQGVKLYPESAQCTPNPVQRGKDVTSTMEYAVLSGTEAEMPVKETRILQKDGKNLQTLSENVYQRTDGTWVSEVQFTVPPDAEPGTYKINQLVTVPEKGKKITQDVSFTVTE